jgi:hypothetical protein
MNVGLTSESVASAPVPPLDFRRRRQGEPGRGGISIRPNDKVRMAIAASGRVSSVTPSDAVPPTVTTRPDPEREPSSQRVDVTRISSPMTGSRARFDPRLG